MEVRDVNERANIAGAGIDMAQRVMDCGDAGHILLSKRLADDLAPYPRWHAHLHDLGEAEVKHGARVHLFNLYTRTAGNAELPSRLGVKPTPEMTPAPGRWPWWAFVVLSLILLTGAGWWFLSRERLKTSSPLTAAPEPTAAVSGKSIAVLPFENLSSDKENAYFADGVQDEILTRLAKIGTLKVIARTSTERYKSAPRNIPEIARQLGVANLLEGSVQKANQKVRVNVQLIRANDSSHLWAETYDRNLDDIFAVESDVATAIAEKLRATLSGRERTLVNTRPTANLDAYDAYLHGLELDRRSESGPNLRQASNYLEQAVGLDPNFALAWARLSRVKSNSFYQDFDATPQVHDTARDAAEQARRLAPALGEPFLALGYVQLFCERNLAKAREAFEAARERLPNDSDLLYGLSLVDLHQGKATSALDLQDQALVLDPRNALLAFKKAQTLSSLRRFPEARAAANLALTLNPDDDMVQAFMANTYQAEGDLEQSARILDAIPAGPPNLIATRLDFFRGHFAQAVARLKILLAGHENEDDLWTVVYYSLLGEAQQYAGDEAAARESFTRGRDLALANIAKTGGPQGRIHAVLALHYSGLGQKEDALREAHRAVELEGDDLYLRPAAEEILALVELQSGDPQRALEILPRILSANGFSWVTGPVADTPASQSVLARTSVRSPLHCPDERSLGEPCPGGVD